MSGRRANPEISFARRLIVAFAIGVATTSFTYIHAKHWGFRPGDFHLAWFGAVAMLHGANPYVPVFLSRLRAMLAFVFVSSAILAFAVTKDGWRRLPIFLSAPFLVGAAASQWSALLTAGALWAPAATVLTTKRTIAWTRIFGNRLPARLLSTPG